MGKWVVADNKHMLKHPLGPISSLDSLSSLQMRLARKGSEGKGLTEHRAGLNDTLPW